MGDPSALSASDRNLIWRTFSHAATRMTKTPQEAGAFEEFAVADLRRVLGAYPDDTRLQHLVAELRGTSTRFDELWQRHIVVQSDVGPKTIVHPEVGPVTLDCDVLAVAGADLRIVVYTASPTGPDADKLELVRVLGLQKLGAGTPDPTRH